MTADALQCGGDGRRKRLFDSRSWNGIDYVDVGADQRTLCIHFFNGVPDNIGQANVRISGGQRITDVKVTSVARDRAHDEHLDDCLRIILDKPGDFSVYELCLIGDDGKPPERIDPRYACVNFGFKVDCPSDLDCVASCECAPPASIPAAIDYLAKDYASFRQLIYDRLAVTMPEWQERHAPDLGVTLVELLAYAGDHLSYFQDAVATEAYLDTARLRTSVRRHLRLIDYRLHDGCNARAFISVETDTSFDIAPGEFNFIAGHIEPDPGALIDFEDAAALPPDLDVFQPIPLRKRFEFRAARSRIRFHTWGDSECCLPKGTTHATLVDHERARSSDFESELKLETGDFLIFEEVISPQTGAAADADPTRRHVVRLTNVSRSHDALLDFALLEVSWADEDALPFALCLSAWRAPPYCDVIGDISIARGNVILVDHGATHESDLDPVPGGETVGDCACEGSILEMHVESVRFAPWLEDGPVASAEALDADAPAARILAQDPRRALPCVRLTDSGIEWTPRADLLSSGRDDRHFVAEIDDDGRASLRFGNDVQGRAPAQGAIFAAQYRIGGGPAGNVGREAINHMVLRRKISVGAEVLVVRNPLPASGGTAPESVAEARLVAPGTIAARRERAVIAADYAELARRSNKLQGAAAALRWSGSWLEAQVGIDPVASAADDSALADAIALDLSRYRRIGHDLAIRTACPVPLFLELHVCLSPHHRRGEVRKALLDLFSNRELSAGGTGFFHPDKLRFGTGVYLSQIVQAAVTLEGVDSVIVRELRRLNSTDKSALDTGILPIGPFEIAQLDNDPNFPERGALKLNLDGGL